MADGPEELMAGFLEAAVLGMLELDGLLDMGCLHGNITPMAIQSISEVGLSNIAYGEDERLPFPVSVVGGEDMLMPSLWEGVV